MRLACIADIPDVASLILISARTLQASYYTPAQIEGALGTVFAVDRQLIEDKTYFVAESNSQIVGCGGWSRRTTAYGGDSITTVRYAIETGTDKRFLDPSLDAANFFREGSPVISERLTGGESRSSL